MSLQTFEKPGDLYLARGDEVNPFRPLFTGDIVADAAIPGVQDGGKAVVVAHPCSMLLACSGCSPTWRMVYMSAHFRNSM